MIIDLVLATGHLVQALLDDSETLAELLNSAEVSVIAVAAVAID